MTYKEKYHQSMLKKFNGDEQALMDWYRRNQRKAMQHPNNQAGKHRGGFSDPEFARAMARKRHQTNDKV